MSRRPLLTLSKLGKEQTPEAMLIITAEKVAGDLTPTDYVEAGRAVSRQRYESEQVLGSIQYQ